MINCDSLSLSAYMYVLHCFLQCNVGTNKIYMTCAQCRRACFLAGCGGGESRSGGGGGGGGV